MSEWTPERVERTPEGVKWTPDAEWTPKTEYTAFENGYIWEFLANLRGVVTPGAEWTSF